jgi:hypothetical protein
VCPIRGSFHVYYKNTTQKKQTQQQQIKSAMQE